MRVNGFTGFLANYATRGTADDPVRRGLGLLGASLPGRWLRWADWARQAAALGMVAATIPEAGRGTDAGRERGLGVVLKAYRGETFHAETEDERLALRLDKERRRFEPGEQPTTRYRFHVRERAPVPEGPAPPARRRARVTG